MTAYSFAPQSLIAPFGGLDIVWNALLAPFICNEALTRRRIGGCALICLGTGMAGGFGSHSEDDYTLEYIEDTLVNVRVLIYFMLFAVWFLLNQCIFMKRPTGDVIRGVSLGVTAGSIAGNMFCVKATVEILKLCFSEGTAEPWTHWMPYVLLAGAIFFAVFNVGYMTTGLREFEALFMVTLYEGSMIVSGCLSGSVVLLDLKDLETWRIIMYIISVSIVVMGLSVICRTEAGSKAESAEVAEEVDVKVQDVEPKAITAQKTDNFLHPDSAGAALPSGSPRLNLLSFNGPDCSGGSRGSKRSAGSLRSAPGAISSTSSHDNLNRAKTLRPRSQSGLAHFDFNGRSILLTSPRSVAAESIRRSSNIKRASTEVVVMVTAAPESSGEADRSAHTTFSSQEASLDGKAGDSNTGQIGQPPAVRNAQSDGEIQQLHQPDIVALKSAPF